MTVISKTLRDAPGKEGSEEESPAWNWTVQYGVRLCRVSGRGVQYTFEWFLNTDSSNRADCSESSFTDRISSFKQRSSSLVTESTAVSSAVKPGTLLPHLKTAKATKSIYSSSRCIYLIKSACVAYTGLNTCTSNILNVQLKSQSEGCNGLVAMDSLIDLPECPEKKQKKKTKKHDILRVNKTLDFVPRLLPPVNLFPFIVPSP